MVFVLFGATGDLAKRMVLLSGRAELEGVGMRPPLWQQTPAF